MWAPNDCAPSSGAEYVIATSAIVLTALQSAGSTLPGLGVAAGIALRIVTLVQVHLLIFAFLGNPSMNVIYRMLKTTMWSSSISRMMRVALYIPSLSNVVG